MDAWNDDIKVATKECLALPSQEGDSQPEPNIPQQSSQQMPSNKPTPSRMDMDSERFS